MGDAYIGPGAEKLSYQGVLYTSTCSGRFCAELPDMNMVRPIAPCTSEKYIGMRKGIVALGMSLKHSVPW